MNRFSFIISSLLFTLAMSAQTPQGPFEQGLKERVVLRTDDVVFRQIDAHTWYGTGHVMANETVYLLEGKKRAMLIDCGTVMHDLDKIVAKLTRKPVSLFLTHARPDHAGMAINYYKDVYLNAADTIGMQEFAPHYQGQMHFLRDGEIIDLGGRKIQVVFTPAHTPGSTTFIDLDRQIGFSGDSFGNGNLLLTGTFPTLRATAEKMAEYMKKHHITQLWNGHYFGGNTESLKRVADEVTISDDALSGKITPTGKMMMDYDELGLYHCIDTLGVKINFSKGAYYSDDVRKKGIDEALRFLNGCKKVYVAAILDNKPMLTTDVRFKASESGLCLSVAPESELSSAVATNQNAGILATDDAGRTLKVSCRLVKDNRYPSLAIYKIKEVTATIGGRTILF